MINTWYNSSFHHENFPFSQTALTTLDLAIQSFVRKKKKVFKQAMARKEVHGTTSSEEESGSEESKVGSILAPPLPLWALPGSSAFCVLICNKTTSSPSPLPGHRRVR